MGMCVCVCEREFFVCLWVCITESHILDMIIFALNAIPHLSFIINRKIKPTTSYLSWHIEWNHITQDKFSSMQDDIYVNLKTGFKLCFFSLSLFLFFRLYQFLFPLFLFARSLPQLKLCYRIRRLSCATCSPNNCYSLCYTRWRQVCFEVVVSIIINLSHHHRALSLMRPLDHNRKCTKNKLLRFR